MRTVEGYPNRPWEHHWEHDDTWTFELFLDAGGNLVDGDDRPMPPWVRDLCSALGREPEQCDLILEWAAGGCYDTRTPPHGPDRPEEHRYAVGGVLIDASDPSLSIRLDEGRYEELWRLVEDVIHEQEIPSDDDGWFDHE